ncbi:hypothetical protein Pint_10224 [Pistacia integerrima]|uniref:Uncharacterized protein n=1 Tax=Pistacia integerrima TaxID=434235 RepID=A0ACC0XEC4_9ROSI|nr:hypothetical protein Pint_10224 [Pistacia integerrima]
MSKVVSILESQTIIQEVISDPSIYGSDFQLQQLGPDFKRKLSPKLSFR